MMLYTVNRKTKEHRVLELAWYVDKKVVEADDDGWIPWNGGECPLPDGVLCEVALRGDGNTHKRPGKECNEWVWSHIGIRSDIIAYRPILDAKPDALEWDGEGQPPVGCECEFMEIDDGEGFFSRTTVIARHGSVVWLSGNGLCEERKLTFRPVLRADEKAVDELASNILDTVNRDGIDFSHDEKVIAKRLYDMGYRKVGD